MTRPLVSVVIATHNRPHLLRAAVDAALAQDYDGPIHVLAVFDQSEPDGSLLREDPRRRVTVHANTRTPGLAGARNTGILAADGELVAFCDDDDTWVVDKLTRQVDDLEAHPGAEASVGGIRVHHGDKVVERVPGRSLLTFHDLLRDRVVAAHPSTFVVRRAALVGHVGLVDEAIPGSYGEDHDLMLRAAKAQPLRVVDAPLAEVLWGKTSYFADRWQSIVDALDYLEDKFPEFSDVPVGLARLRGRKAFALAALGRRRAALRTAFGVLRVNPRDLRAYAGIAVASGVIDANRAIHVANRFGRGI